VNISTEYLEPSVYVDIQEVVSPTLPQGPINVCFIGTGSDRKTGSKTKTVGQETVTITSNGVGPYDLATLINWITSKMIKTVESVVDEYGKTYRAGEGNDYTFTTPNLTFNTGKNPAAGKRFAVTVTFTQTGGEVGPYKIKPIGAFDTDVDVKEIIKVVDQYGKEYKATDYTPDESSGTIKFVANHGPATGVQFTVTSEVQKTVEKDYYTPIAVSDSAAAVALFGEVTPTNSLSLGASLYFANNGGSPLYCVQIEEASGDTGFTKALDAIKNEDMYLIVPLIATNTTTDSYVLTYMEDHVRNMSNKTEGKRRIAFMGGPASMDDVNNSNDSVDKYIAAATSLSFWRCFYMYPATGKVNIGNAVVTVDGPFIAAAFAGVNSNSVYNVAEPMSGKELVGIDIVDYLVRWQKNKLASNGVTIVEKDGSSKYIRHFLTTDPSTVISSEGKVVKIGDYVANVLSKSLRKIFINTLSKGTESLIGIKSTTEMLLDQIKRQNIIVDYGTVEAAFEPSDPRQVNLKVQIRPSFDINWIYVTLTLSI
jgi:hypothetical protein